MSSSKRGVALLVVAFGVGACGPPDIIEAEGGDSEDSEASGDTQTGPGTETDEGEASSESSTETDAGAPECGDGVVDEGEACDDGNDDPSDGCLSTCVVARICSQILAEEPAASDGVYVIDPDGDGGEAAFSAYCDMSQDGGGWTLAAKVHRFHGGDAYVEPRGWFADTRDTDALLDAVSYEDRPAALASHGQARLGPALAEIAVARFAVIAEDDPDQRATWFKGVEADAFAWFSDQDHAPTPVCEDPELSLGCDDGRILSAGWTPLGGMNLSDYGYTSGCVVHMRIDGDDNGEVFSSLCSCTDDNDNNAWDDDAGDGHWGNGLEIWLR